MIIISNPEALDNWVPCPPEDAMIIEALDDDANWLAIPFADIKRGYVIRAWHAPGEPYQDGRCSIAINDAEHIAVGRGYSAQTISWIPEDEMREKVVTATIDQFGDAVDAHIASLKEQDAE